ncbi:MAG TPA: hypothetical protein VFB72_01735 [Verrucomicrobiae bacterium]|nr:hypothetical protein [Verrucomicrobiae bacterium]
MVAEVSKLAPATDGYEKVVLEIEKYRDATISVPMLSRLLGVKTTTINARFRREGILPNTIGRTNFIPGEIALSLADMHRHALKGWPTLHEVSRLTGIKTGTLKARCEKGKLEGYVDLTKRLRINPAEVPHLSIDRSTPPVQPASRSISSMVNRPFSGEPARRVAQPKPAPEFTRAPASTPFVLPPAPEPRVQIITARDYGLAARTNGTATADFSEKKHKEKHKERKRGALDYNPESPFSISQCSVGKTVKYEKYDGTILKLIPDPFNPAIKVAFPNHDEPLMREILLRVAR